MALTKVQQFMLYALGTCSTEIDSRFSNTPITITMNKVNFIDLVHNAGIVKKGDRAVYRNLEQLEKLKLVAYNNRVISLTQKGIVAYNKIKMEIGPYIAVTKTITSDDILKYSERTQTVLR